MVPNPVLQTFMPNQKMFLIYWNFILKIVFVYKSIHSVIYSTISVIYYYIDKCCRFPGKKDKITHFTDKSGQQFVKLVI